jgi:hypothetical protein
MTVISNTTTADAFGGLTSDDAEAARTLVTVLAKTAKANAEERPVTEGVTVLLARLAAGADGDLLELVGADYEQALLHVEPLSSFYGQMYPGVSALTSRASTRCWTSPKTPSAPR